MLQHACSVVEPMRRAAGREPFRSMADPSPRTPHPAPVPGQPPRWFLPVVGASIVLMIAANNLGNVVWSCAVAKEPAQASSMCTWPGVSWFEGNPLGLLALNSSNKYLLATSVLTELAPFAAVALVRLMAPDPLFFLLGLTYRGRALHWARRAFPGMEPVIDQFESQGGATRRVLDTAVFIAPNNPVCLLAGVARMTWMRFVVLAVTGTLARIALMRGIGQLFRDQIEDVLEIVGRYQRWFTLGSLLLVAAYLAHQVLGRRGLVGGVEHLEEELGDP
mgnify:CR=1 FL=1